MHHGVPSLFCEGGTFAAMPKLSTTEKLATL